MENDKARIWKRSKWNSSHSFHQKFHHIAIQAGHLNYNFYSILNKKYLNFTNIWARFDQSIITRQFTAHIQNLITFCIGGCIFAKIRSWIQEIRSIGNYFPACWTLVVRNTGAVIVCFALIDSWYSLNERIQMVGQNLTLRHTWGFPWEFAIIKSTDICFCIITFRCSSA